MEFNYYKQVINRYADITPEAKKCLIDTLQTACDIKRVIDISLKEIELAEMKYGTNKRLEQQKNKELLDKAAISYVLLKLNFRIQGLVWNNLPFPSEYRWDISEDESNIRKEFFQAAGKNHTDFYDRDISVKGITFKLINVLE